ncbi:hypothetical protein LSM04_002759 [Trypanosoma melophagium]|nr:hypothetical protein LSM04_002759 [Trypanosoma melophagium]
MYYIYALLYTAGDAARHVAGVSDEEALPPAARESADTIMTGNTTTTSKTTNNITSTIGIGDRTMRGSSTMYVWMRAFSVIPFSGGKKRNNCRRSLLQYQPPSYTPLQSRKKARLVMVNCSDGWDRTPQVCALTQLLLDPYFRTVEGFITLLEKEFVAFGHPCITRSSTLRGHSDVDRSNHTHHHDNSNNTSTNNNSDSNNNNSGGGELPEGTGDDCTAVNAGDNMKSSPILLQFIDAVRQLRQMYPHCFEFTEAFLLLLVDVMHAGLVGTFAVNCERDVRYWELERQTLSLSQFCAVLFATTIRPTTKEKERGTGVRSSSAASSSVNDRYHHHTHHVYGNGDVLINHENEESAEDDDEDDNSSNYNTIADVDMDHHDNSENIQDEDISRNNLDNPCSGNSNSHLAPPLFLPLRCFYQACGGGATLRGVGWCTPNNTNSNNATNTKPRRLHVSCDAILHSGLINPHFSLEDNKNVIGPLLDAVRLSHITLWEGLLLRYSYWSEWRSKLRCFSECSPHTFHKAVMNAVDRNAVELTFTTDNTELQEKQQQQEEQKEEREKKEEQHQQRYPYPYPYQEKRQPSMEERPHSTPSIVLRDSMSDAPLTDSHVALPVVPPRGILIGVCNNSNNNSINTSGIIHTIGGGNTGRLAPRRLPRPASYAAMPGSPSTLQSTQQQQEEEEQDESYPYQEKRQPSMEERPHSTPSIVLRDSMSDAPLTDSHAALPVVPPRGILIGVCNNSNNNSINTSGIIHTIGGGNTGRLAPRRLPRPASYAAMPGSPSTLQSTQQEKEKQQATSPARQKSRGRGYGTLLDELDQAFTE